MQKSLLVVISIFLIALQVQAQKFFTRTGHISFHASTPLENIDALTKEAASVIDISRKGIVFQVPVKSFLFKKALMQEHFNENYMESTKYPMAIFKGRIRDDAKTDLSRNGIYTVVVEGDLTIHGVTRKVSVNASISRKDNSINADAVFKVKAADYNIRIPSLVEDKIAKEIEIQINCSYQPMK